MGTDIFLYKQNADFEKDKPESYIRAGFLSENENGFLRMIFPDQFWHEENYDLKIDPKDNELYATHGLRYEFKTEGLELLRKIGDYYLEAYNNGTEFKKFEFPFKEQLGFGTLDSSVIDLIDSQHWLEEVIEFYEKGLELEKKNLKPEVYINW